MPVGRGFTAARQQASRLAQGAVPLDPGLRAAGAQGRRETCQLAVKLPPLGDGPRGSRKGQCPLIPDCALCAQGRRGICQLAGVLPPLGNRPRGSRKGQCPLTPDCALCAQSARRKADWLLSTAARRRASWLANKASVDLISRWPFALRKNISYAKASHPAGVEYVPRQLRRGRAAIGSGGKKARPF